MLRAPDKSRTKTEQKSTRTKEEDCEPHWRYVAILAIGSQLARGVARINTIYHEQLHTRNQSMVNHVNFLFHTLSTSSPKVMTMS